MLQYRFAGLVLDLGRGTLLRAGLEVPLRPKSFALLRLLVENAGTLMDRDAIASAVWPGMIVTDESISQCIQDVRRAIADPAKRIVRTVQRRGYLFVASVEQGARSANNVQVPPVTQPRIAVAPFVSDESWAHLAESLVEEIATALTRFTPLTVVSTRSCLGDAASLSDARYRLTGSVRAAGDRLRMTVQFVDAITAAHLCAWRYDRPPAAGFSMQEDIAERIAGNVARYLEHHLIERARHAPPATPRTPYELLLLGRAERRRSRREGIQAAEMLFEEAISLDPGFAMAHAELANLHYTRVTWRMQPELADQMLGKGFDRVERALGLNASLPLANSALGKLYLRAREHDDAIRWAEHAVALSPRDAEARVSFANVLSYVGRSEEALHHLAQAKRLEACHPPLWDCYTGRALLHLGRYEQALACLDRGLRRAPFFGNWRSYRAVALAQLGRLDESRMALPDPNSPQAFGSITALGRLDAYCDSPELELLSDGLRMAGYPE